MRINISDGMVNWLKILSKQAGVHDEVFSVDKIQTGLWLLLRNLIA
jgi:hypothetical protein